MTIFFIISKSNNQINLECYKNNPILIWNIPVKFEDFYKKKTVLNKIKM